MPSDREILRQAALIECRENGHDFCCITQEQSLDPVAVVCERCGAHWTIAWSRQPGQPAFPWDRDAS